MSDEDKKSGPNAWPARSSSGFDDENIAWNWLDSMTDAERHDGVTHLTLAGLIRDVRRETVEMCAGWLITEPANTAPDPTRLTPHLRGVAVRMKKSAPFQSLGTADSSGAAQAWEDAIRAAQLIAEEDLCWGTAARIRALADQFTSTTPKEKT
jgi:hypothetical protein